MSIKICRLTDCEKPAEAKRSVCAMHYGRYRRYGDFTTVRRAALPSPEAFWQQVAISPDETKCWEWTGKPHATGYGYACFIGEHHCHRIAFILWNGKLPDQWVLHHCDNRLCCNPHHLYDGGPTENNRDMKARNRYNNPKLPYCKRGHAMEGVNLYFRPNGQRMCKACRNIQAAKSKARVRIREIEKDRRAA